MMFKVESKFTLFFYDPTSFFITRCGMCLQMKKSWRRQHPHMTDLLLQKLQWAGLSMLGRPKMRPPRPTIALSFACFSCKMHSVNSILPRIFALVHKKRNQSLFLTLCLITSHSFISTLEMIKVIESKAVILKLWKL